MSDLTDKITGRAKKAIGDVTDSASTRRQGEKEEAKGEAKEDAARAADAAEAKQAEADRLDQQT